MPVIRNFLRECLLTERNLFQLIIYLAVISLISLSITSAIVFFDEQLSISWLWLLVLFHITGLGLVGFLSLMLACTTRWTRSSQEVGSGQPAPTDMVR